MTKYYRIKEFSRLTSVTIRTLHYYDEISLLKPSHRSARGHRLYSENDMLKLQQITTFKFLGFSLEQINQLISHPGFNVKDSLKTQEEILAAQAKKIQSAAKLLQQVVKQLDTHNTVDWQTITQIIEVFQMKDTTLETWLKKFFSKAELSEFNQQMAHYSAEQMQSYSDRWAKLFAEVKKNIQADPKGDVGQKLAQKWLTLVDEVYGNYPNIRNKLWQAFKAGAAPTSKDFMPYYDQSVIDYIDIATGYYLKNK